MALVLVVDQKEQNRHLLETLFHGKGHEVMTAQSGSEAIDRAVKRIPDVVVTEVLMPDMDGLALCRAWNTNDSLRDIPLIFYSSANTDHQDIEFAENHGVERFVGKPAEPTEILRVLEGVLSDRIKTRNSPDKPGVDEWELLKRQNDTLMRKLEIQIEELEKSNRELEDANRLLNSKNAELRILESAIASVPAGVLIADAQSEGNPIIYCNPAFRTITGYSNADVIGRPFQFMFTDEGDKKSVDKVRAAIREQRPCTVRIRSFRKDGNPFWNKIAISPVFDSSSNVSHFIGIQEDVSAEIKADEELRETERQLSHISRLSTMGEMAAGLVHELGQPLHTIQCYSVACLNLLSRKQPESEDELINWIEEIKTTAEYSGEVVSKMRGFVSRLKTKWAKTDMKEIIETAMTLVKHELNKHGAAIEMDIEPNLPKIEADAVQLQQVLVNLLRNACEATRELGKVPKIRVRARAQSGGVEVSVLDNGPGVQNGCRNRIFEPFYSSKNDGMGIGLAICKTIIEGHEGTVWAEDRTSGTGAEICFRIPAAAK